jgi:tetraacyldisaccharide 4'-kinase
VIITAKDAVKVLGSDHSHNAIADNIWVLEIEAQIEGDFIDRLAAQLQALKADN